MVRRLVKPDLGAELQVFTLVGLTSFVQLEAGEASLPFGLLMGSSSEASGQLQDVLLVTGVKTFTYVLNCVVVAPRVKLYAGRVGTGLRNRARRETVSGFEGCAV